ncbi:sodium/glutamate symporter [Thalassotalea sp. HSM 43]|uniref:sodium/glutamate symporter n=1 Tax=Thalassotalea sp. HSM 43 TaxID=2552945 RepID=UPI001E3936D5|nr:sodium/glutamate symporter [Thalassotalea sp. HSM 43]
MGIEFIDGILAFNGFHAVSFGILVLFVGKRLNQKVGFLREFSIPEPVTGGILFSVIFTLVYLIADIEVTFDLYSRDVLLVYFFTTIGINANLRDLLKGGIPLLILLTVTVGYIFVQNLTGITIARLFDMDSAVGVLGGSVSLIGGHGTAIAWSPRIASDYGVESAMEIGIACATFGLILASLMGGPIAKYLIKKHNLTPNEEDTSLSSDDDAKHNNTIDSHAFLDAILAIHICAFLGIILNEVIEQAGLQLPLFVTCLFAGIIVTNIMPKKYPRISGLEWPSRSPAIQLIADMSLGTFLAMSLMSMQLWALVDLAGPIMSILLAQFVVAILINIFIVFKVMGKNYDAAVICSGFGGISLGSTPTAMANMSAVSKRYGTSTLAFIVVPLVCAFFIDLANALIIPFFLSSF